MRKSTEKSVDFFVQMFGNVDFFIILRQYKQAGDGVVQDAEALGSDSEMFAQKNLHMSIFFLTFVLTK